jgi:hypothetical protein
VVWVCVGVWGGADDGTTGWAEELFSMPVVVGFCR